jgi:hypothetical protein
MTPVCSPGFRDCWSIQLTKKIFHRLSTRAALHGSRATDHSLRRHLPRPCELRLCGCVIDRGLVWRTWLTPLSEAHPIPVDVRLCTHNGVNSDIAPSPFRANNRHKVEMKEAAN